MPLKIIKTLSSEAANRRAYDAGEASGLNSLNKSAASFGRFARVPPFTGSITIIGLPCLTAVS